MSSCRDSSYGFPCLYQVIGDSSLIPVRSELFTPVAVVWGVLLGPKHSRGAVPGPFAGLAPGRARSTRLGGSWTASFPRWFRLRDVQHRGRPFSTAQGSSFRRGSVDHKPRVRMSSTGQREDQTWPISPSVPRFSFGISQLYRPSGRSREGFVGGLLESK